MKSRNELIKRKSYRLFGHFRKIISDTLLIMKSAYSVGAIIVTIVRLPATLKRISEFRKAELERLEREARWFESVHEEDTISFENLPYEIQMIICSYLDANTLCHLAQTNSKIHHICMDNFLWIEKLVADFPDYSVKQKSKRVSKAMHTSIQYFKSFIARADSKSSNKLLKISPALHLYKQRFLSYKRFSDSSKASRKVKGIPGIVIEEGKLASSTKSC
ncbi:hypothetical protein HDV06_000597 [Boothiomyces sp. JEL0866]|nr:hypothetical protein HDV06_000597 [Boothiomyces sp. JEL0866]